MAWKGYDKWGNLKISDPVSGIPAARVYNSTAVNVTNGAQTALTFDTERYDTDAIHDTSTATSRLTCKTAGVYTIVGYATLTLSASGVIRQLRILLNGTTPIAAQVVPFGSALIPRGVVVAQWSMNVGDYVELQVFADAASIQATSDAANGPEFSMTWDGPQKTPLNTGNLVTALPSTTGLPDGFEVRYLADATNGVVWNLKYRAAETGSYKWYFMGGAPLYTEVTTAETTTSATFVALTTAGPVVTLPLVGDYDMEIGARIFNNSSNRSNVMSYDIGGTAASATDGTDFFSAVVDPTGGATPAPSVARSRRKTALTAVALTSKYKTSGGTATFENRWMKATPVRVG